MNTVIDAHNISKVYNPETIPVYAVNNVHLHLERGEFTALVGPSGSGKTTLLKLILGELQASSGQVRQGANLQVAYFDQMRNALDLDATLEDFISPGSEWVEINGTRKHADYATSLPNDFGHDVFWDVELKAKDLAIAKMLQGL